LFNWTGLFSWLLGGDEQQSEGAEAVKMVLVELILKRNKKTNCF
jgi:hypothetical protein